MKAEFLLMRFLHQPLSEIKKMPVTDLLAYSKMAEAALKVQV